MHTNVKFPSQYGHVHGRITNHDDPPDDTATYDAAIHNDAAAVANSSADYDAVSAEPENGHTGNAGVVQHACGKSDGTKVILTVRGIQQCIY